MTEEQPISIQLWIRQKRMVVALPLSSEVFHPNGPVMRLAFQVCGKDAVAVGDIGAKLRGLAFCSKHEASEWRNSLGMTLEEEP